MESFIVHCGSLPLTFLILGREPENVLLKIADFPKLVTKMLRLLNTSITNLHKNLNDQINEKINYMETPIKCY